MKKKVYLAGGMKSLWQLKFTDSGRINGFVFFDPSNHELKIPREYTAWDIHHVKECDVLFAYLEKDNPSGIGLSLEMGIALAMGKTVIFVDEWNNSKSAILVEASTVHFNNLEDGIQFLLSLQKGVSI